MHCVDKLPHRLDTSGPAGLRTASVTTTTRSVALPGYFGLGGSAAAFVERLRMAFGAKSTPPSHRQVLVEINVALADPDVEARFAELAEWSLEARPPISGSASPKKRWSRVIRTANIETGVE